MINSAVCSGDKDGSDFVNYCFDRIRGKNGILRKQCNSTRQMNSYEVGDLTLKGAAWKFVAHPLKGHMGYIYLPNEVFDKGRFLFMAEDGGSRRPKLRRGTWSSLGAAPCKGPTARSQQRSQW